MSTAYNNCIRIPLIDDHLDYWGNTSIGRMIRDRHLVLRPKRGDYNLVSEGKGVKTKPGYSSVYGNKERKRIGFRMFVKDSQEDLYLALIEIANYTAGDGCYLQPIDLVDHIHLHDRLDRERGYRIRRGVFEGEFTQIKGTSTQGYIDCEAQEHSNNKVRYTSGFSFKFMETEFLQGFF